MTNIEIIKKNKRAINLEDSVILNYLGMNKRIVPYSQAQHFEDMELKGNITPLLKLKEVTIYKNGSYMTKYTNY